jgi:maleate cis-trans isomerase
MGILANREIGRVAPGENVEFVEERMSGAVADCIFLSCTNWQAIAAIEPISALRRASDLEQPVHDRRRAAAVARFRSAASGQRACR